MFLRLLGGVEVERGGEILPLPPSRRTRALLAYLALTGREHRREKLCTLLWDVTDDPKGALRWSLSKIRALVDEPGCARLRADRDEVSLAPGSLRIDLLDVRERLAAGTAGLATPDLEELARAFRGELLHGLDLDDLDVYQAWLVSQREAARTLHGGLLRELVTRLTAEPDRALPYARALLEADPLDEAAHATVLRLLRAAGRRAEAEQRYEASLRSLSALGARRTGELESARAEILSPRRTPAPAPAPDPGPALARPDRLVGRGTELETLEAELRRARESSSLRAVLLSGAPGSGTSRLLAELVSRCRAAGGSVLEARAHESEAGRVLGPWRDALLRAPPPASHELATRLAPLLYHDAPVEDAGTRERLFDAVAALVSARAAAAPPLLLALDDVQWLDAGSVTLLHYVARVSRECPLLLVMAARGGELLDNGPALALVRELRRDRSLSELELQPLPAEEIVALVASIDPSADGARIAAMSAGNPLIAIELARAGPAAGELPRSLATLVQDRLDRLPHDVAHVLAWATVAGRSSMPWLLEHVTGLSTAVLGAALETLQRQAWIDAPSTVAVGFSSEVVREAVYASLAEPRRRLMHGRIARVLSGLPGTEHAPEIARHAALAGEAELAARACLDAARHALRLFAGDQADALARRGLRHAEQLPEQSRTAVAIELLEVRVAAKPPSDAEIAEIEALAERALDLGLTGAAATGFQVLSWLRWESGEDVEARRRMLQAEVISRRSADASRVKVLAEAGRCLALLDRDMSQAEAMIQGAAKLAESGGIELPSIFHGLALVRLHQGRVDEARELLEQGATLARAEGDRLGELRALEQAVMLEQARGRHAEAIDMGLRLATLGGRIRDGAEASFARALLAVSRLALGIASPATLEPALEELRGKGVKRRLAWVLQLAAEIEHGHGDSARAVAHAREALELARELDRPSDSARAALALRRAARALEDAGAAALARDALTRLDAARLAEDVRVRLAEEKEGAGSWRA